MIVTSHIGIPPSKDGWEKINDIKLSALRDAMDYIADFRLGKGSIVDGSRALTSKESEAKIGKLMGVRLNSVGDMHARWEKVILQVSYLHQILPSSSR